MTTDSVVTDQVTAPPELTRAEVRDRIAVAAAARDEGMAWAEMAEDERGGWTRSLIDQAIAWFAQTGQRFSANDLRELLPDDLPVQGLMGSRFRHAANHLGLIRQVVAEVRYADDSVGYIPVTVPSTKENTHAKGVTVWVGVANEEPGG